MNPLLKKYLLANVLRAPDDGEPPRLGMVPPPRQQLQLPQLARRRRPAKPWYDGKADAEIIGHMQNNGWDKDPVTAAIEASEVAPRAAEIPRRAGKPAGQAAEGRRRRGRLEGGHSRLGMPAEAKEYDLSGVKRADGTELDQPGGRAARRTPPRPGGEGQCAGGSEGDRQAHGRRRQRRRPTKSGSTARRPSCEGLGRQFRLEQGGRDAGRQAPRRRAGDRGRA
jgi:hypothetical protein